MLTAEDRPDLGECIICGAREMSPQAGICRRDYEDVCEAEGIAAYPHMEE